MMLGSLKGKQGMGQEQAEVKQVIPAKASGMADHLCRDRHVGACPGQAAELKPKGLFKGLIKDGIGEAWVGLGELRSLKLTLTARGDTEILPQL